MIKIHFKTGHLHCPRGGRSFFLPRQCCGHRRRARSRINTARVELNMHRKIWSSKKTSPPLRYASSVKQVMLNGSETWRTTQHTTHRLQTFINTCLRRILNIWWKDKVNNVEKNKSRTHSLTNPGEKVELDWSHPQKTCYITRQALEWNPQGKRKRGFLHVKFCKVYLLYAAHSQRGKFLLFICYC